MYYFIFQVKLNWIITFNLDCPSCPIFWSLRQIFTLLQVFLANFSQWQISKLIHDYFANRQPCSCMQAFCSGYIREVFSLLMTLELLWKIQIMMPLLMRICRRRLGWNRFHSKQGISSSRLSGSLRFEWKTTHIGREESSQLSRWEQNEERSLPICLFHAVSTWQKWWAVKFSHSLFVPVGCLVRSGPFRSTDQHTDPALKLNPSD